MGGSFENYIIATLGKLFNILAVQYWSQHNKLEFLLRVFSNDDVIVKFFRVIQFYSLY